MPRSSTAKPPSKRQPKQERAKATVDAMLTGVTHILAKDGYDRVTTNRIAEVAGVSIASLYQYFPNKEALLGARIDRHLADIASMVHRHLSEPGEPLRVLLPRIVRAHLALHTPHSEAHQELLPHLEALQRIDLSAALKKQIVAQTRALLSAHVSELRIRDLDLAALLAVHFLDAATRAAVLEHPALLKGDALPDAISDMLLRYLLRDG